MLVEPKPGFRYRRDATTGETYLEVPHGGFPLIDMPLFNKGTAFTQAEREELGLVGLLPPCVVTQQQQIDRVLWTFAHQESDLERYLHLNAVADRNETLFYRILVDRFEEMLPVVYTPTVGLACQHYGRIFRRSRGIFLTPADAHRIGEILGSWRFPDVRIVVVTDGERVLGLGDLGAGGMGISIGKGALYVAGAGIHPAQVLPVCLDVGTDNRRLLDDPLYLGTRHERLRGEAYDAFVAAFLAAVADRFPQAVVQFEDFASGNALRLLAAHGTTRCCFNDDVQGTGAVARAAVVAGLRGTDHAVSDLRVVIAGAGSAGVGIARALGDAEIWIVDHLGLLTEDRRDLWEAQRPYARSGPARSLGDVVRTVRPHVLVGVTGSPGLFTREMVQTMEGPHPLVLPLSNPTALAECTPDQVREWSAGLARVATGSPFPETAQCNNVYVFPGLGLGVLLARASLVTTSMLDAAAGTVACMAPEDRLLPPLSSIRDVSRAVALAVARQARSDGVARVAADVVLEERLADLVWEPDYVRYRRADA